MKNLYLKILWILCALALVSTFGLQGDLITDVGREAYYPQAMLSGSVLYKDLFVIYGPFAYFFNAFLYKIFGANLSTLYAAGFASTFLIVTFIYFIAKRFFSEMTSLLLGVVTLITGVFSLNLFNFVFPYSYAMIYGLVAFLASVLLLLKAAEGNEKALYLSGLMAGVAFANKYEFVPYILVFLFLAWQISPKKIFKTLAFMSIVPLICTIVLAFQGVTPQIASETLNIYNIMAKTEALSVFYKSCGIFVSTGILFLDLINFLLFGLSVLAINWAVIIFEKRKFLSVFVICFVALWNVLFIKPISFIFFPLLLLCLIFLNLKKLKVDIKLQVLSLSAIAVCAKFLWGLVLSNYGLFGFGIAFIAILALLKDKISQRTMNIFLIICVLGLAYYYLPQRQAKVFTLKTQKGQISVKTPFYASTQNLLEYINKETKPSDKIVVLPEGQLINFFTNRPSENYYNSFIPLYIETFGEEKLIEEYKKSKPDYIIFNNERSDYREEHICEDYAQKFCGFVKENYHLEKIISSGFKYYVYKRKV